MADTRIAGATADRLRRWIEYPPSTQEDWIRRVGQEINRLEAIEGEAQGYSDSDALAEARQWPELMAVFVYLALWDGGVPVSKVWQWARMVKDGYEIRRQGTDSLADLARERVAQMLGIGAG